MHFWGGGVAYACDASIRKFLSSPKPPKKTIELCASKVLFHRELPTEECSSFAFRVFLTRMAAFTNTAQIAGNLSTVHWKLLLSRDWGRAPTLAPSLPRIFSILSAILYLGNITYRKRATGRDEGLEVGPPEALDTLSQLLKVLSLGLSHSGRPLRPKLPALAEPLSAASSPAVPAVSLPRFFSFF